MSSSSTASKLDRLIGLGSAKQLVSSFYQSKTDTHAILFYGPEGSGKNELAQLLAQYWLCSSPNAEGADGTCRACGASERATNPDLLRISPMGAGNLITIKQFEVRPQTADESITPLQQFIRTSPLLSRNKVVIIQDADRMNEAASNSLLKTLEQPPRFLQLVLTTTSPSGLRSTILSRVLAVACSLPTREQITEVFPEATDANILISESAPGRLARILAHPKPYQEIWDFSHRLLGRPRGEALLASEELRGISEKLDRALQCGMRSAHAEVIQTMSIIFARTPEFPAQWAQSAIVAHERVMANVNAGLVIDGLLANL